MVEGLRLAPSRWERSVRRFCLHTPCRILSGDNRGTLSVFVAMPDRSLPGSLGRRVGGSWDVAA